MPEPTQAERAAFFAEKGEREQAHRFVRSNAHDLKLKGASPTVLDEVRKLKARELHDAACAIQDQLNLVNVYIGDDALIDAKVAIQKACDKARSAAEKVLYG